MVSQPPRGGGVHRPEVPVDQALAYPGVVKLPRLRAAENTADEVIDEPLDDVADASRAYTPAKGRPTPKRREAESRRRGPVAPPPMTQREAMKRSRVNKADRRTAAALVAMVAPVPLVQAYAAPGTVVILLLMIVEGLLLARTVVKRVRAKFPDARDRSLSLGWYSFVRASQIRKLRIPKPMVKVGDEVV